MAISLILLTLIVVLRVITLLSGTVAFFVSFCLLLLSFLIYLSERKRVSKYDLRLNSVTRKMFLLALAIVSSSLIGSIFIDHEVHKTFGPINIDIIIWVIPFGLILLDNLGSSSES